MLLFSFLSVLATLSIGGIVVRTVCPSNLPVSLRVGASYGIGVAIIGGLSTWLSSHGLSLTVVSWLLLTTGITIGIMHIPVIRVKSAPITLQQDNAGNGQSAIYTNANTLTPLYLFFLALIIIHMGLILYGSMNLPIFFWDAFTSWMYKAKAWLAQDSITPLISATSWLQAESNTLFSAKGYSYRDTIPAYAAFLCVIAGGWHWQSVSLAWFFGFSAICLSIYGVSMLACLRHQVAVTATYLVASLPLLNIHAAFAGYADIWTTLLSGTGLALILVWRSTHKHEAIGLALLMLAAGATIKNEGGLWLLLGLVFISWEFSRTRFGLLLTAVSTTCTLLTLLTLYWLGIRELEIPLLGNFGINDKAINAGFLGSYDIRPVNTAQSFANALFAQSNFLLLPIFYVTSLAIITVKKPNVSLPIQAFNALLIASFTIIFGLSAYSKFAEAGTVISRVLLQVTPVFVAAMVLVWRSLNENDLDQLTPVAVKTLSRTNTHSVLLIGLSLILIISVSVVSDRFLPASSDLDFNAGELVPVASDVKHEALGVKLTHSSLGVGVLKLPTTRIQEPLPKYLSYDISFFTEGDVSFYWVPEGGENVQSYSLTNAGEYIQRLDKIDAWQGPLKEAGLLIKTSAFGDTWIRRIQLKNKITKDDWLSVTDAWTKPASVTQSEVNFTLGHSDAPINLVSAANWLLATVIAFSLIAARFLRSQNILGALCALTLILWVASDLLLMKNSAVMTAAHHGGRPLPKVEEAHTDQWGRYLPAIAKSIQAELPEEAPLIIVPVSDTTNFPAQILPFHLIPSRAITLMVGQGKKIPKQWPGGVVILGTPSEPPEALASKISQASDMRIISDFGHYQILYGNGAD